MIKKLDGRFELRSGWCFEVLGGHNQMEMCKQRKSRFVTSRWYFWRKISRLIDFKAEVDSRVVEGQLSAK